MNATSTLVNVINFTVLTVRTDQKYIISYYSIWCILLQAYHWRWVSFFNSLDCWMVFSFVFYCSIRIGQVQDAVRATNRECFSTDQEHWPRRWGGVHLHCKEPIWRGNLLCFYFSWRYTRLLVKITHNLLWSYLNSSKITYSAVKTSYMSKNNFHLSKNYSPPIKNKQFFYTVNTLLTKSRLPNLHVNQGIFF